MKKQLLFTASAALLMLASCTGSTEPQQSPDLQALGLKGQVKEITHYIYDADEEMTMGDSSYPGSKYTFDEKGNLVSEDDYIFQVEDLKRDEKGRIVAKHAEDVSDSEGDDYNIYDMTYTYGEGFLPLKVYTIISGVISYTDDTENQYDAEGNLTSAKSNSIFDGNTDESSTQYTILETDEMGNWTRRFIATQSVQQLLDGDNNLLEADTTSSYSIDIRQIIYY